jgi:GNAT superfamily N-acetyltransferase
MLFASAELVARIERAECCLVTDCATAVRRKDPGVLIIPIGSGTATHGGTNSPLNKVVGLGFAPPPDRPQGAPTAQALFESKLAEIEQLWSQRSTPVQVELSTFAEPSIGATLTKRGYILRGFENVLGLPLPRQAQPPGRPSGGIHVEINPPENLRQWLDTVVTGFATPDTQGVASHESYPREAIEKAMDDMASAEGFTHVLARRGGVVAGGASLKVSDRIAQLCGAATLPEHRRRGVQGALFEFRLDAAARAGCDLAVVTTLPGSKSQENAQRRGFSPLYTRAVLVLEPRASPLQPPASRVE